MFEEIKPEIKTTAPLIEEMKNEFKEQSKILDNEQNKSGPGLEKKKVIPWDKVASGVCNFEGAVIASIYTKNSPDFIKESAREICKPSQGDIELMAQILDGLADKYAPQLLNNENAPLIILALTYSVSTISKANQVKYLVDSQGGKK